MFEYEHTSKFSVAADTREALVKEIEGDEFHLSPILGKVMLNDIEDLLDAAHGKNLREIEIEFINATGIISEEIIHEMFNEINDFIFIDPKIPDNKKNYTKDTTLDISAEDNREKIIDTIWRNTGNSELALLTLYVYRQMDKINWLPFIKASLERNPVCITELNGKTASDVYNILKGMSEESIYDGARLALPDEVWNFNRGDGIEKALLLADFIHFNDTAVPVSISIKTRNVVLKVNETEYHFSSNKNLKKSIMISGTTYKIT